MSELFRKAGSWGLFAGVNSAFDCGAGGREGEEIIEEEWVALIVWRAWADSELFLRWL